MSRKADPKQFIDIADRLLVGDIHIKSSDVTSTSDPFARAFVFMVGYLGMPTVPVDDALLAEAGSSIDYLAGEQGVGTYSFLLDKDWEETDIGSFLTRNEDGSPVAVVQKNGIYYEADPLTGRLKTISRKRASELGPDAVTIFPGIQKGQAQRFLPVLLKDIRFDIVLFVLFSIICAFISMMLPALFAHMVSEVVPYGNRHDSYLFSVILLACLGTLLCLQIVVNRIRLRLQTRVQSKSYYSYMRNILKLSSGSMRRISNRVVSLTIPYIDAADAFAGSIVGLGTYLIQSIFALISVCIYTSETGGFFLVIVMASFVSCLGLMYRRYRVKVRCREQEEKLTGLRKEMIGNNESVKAYGTEDVMYYRHSLCYNDYLSGNLESNFLQLSASMFTTMLSSLGVFIVIFIKLHGTDGYDLGAVSAVFSAISLFCSYFGMLVNSLMEIADEIPQLRLSREVSKMPMENDDDKGMDVPLKGRIECSHLNFTYDEELPKVIRDLSFTVNPGEYVGIVGGSGCGKSTLLRLLMGFETPSDGSISYDGIDLQAWNLKALRRQFGVVLQDTAVMTGKIADNISGIFQADMEEIREAARKAAILDDIEEMPMKFNTIISGESENVSGGQKQRILLARAILPKPKILFLDEATSALDNISQKKVLESLDEMNITRIVIAHRLSTVRECDRILVMDKGQIAEQGSYDDLMAANGLFRRLVERDMAG